MPEATNFLFNALLILAPHSLERKDIPSPFPILDFEKHSELAVKTKAASKLSPEPAPLVEIINWDSTHAVPEQHKIDLLAVTYALIGQFAELYKELPGFIELFTPFHAIAASLKIRKLSDGLVVSVLLRLLNGRAPSPCRSALGLSGTFERHFDT